MESGWRDAYHKLVAMLELARVYKGSPSLRRIADGAGCSHTSVAKVFSHEPPSLPSHELVMKVANALDADTAEIERQWRVAESRERMAERGPVLTISQDLAETEHDVPAIDAVLASNDVVHQSIHRRPYERVSPRLAAALLVVPTSLIAVFLIQSGMSYSSAHRLNGLVQSFVLVVAALIAYLRGRTFVTAGDRSSQMLFWLLGAGLLFRGSGNAVSTLWDNRIGVVVADLLSVAMYPMIGVGLLMRIAHKPFLSELDRRIANVSAVVAFGFGVTATIAGASLAGEVWVSGKAFVELMIPGADMTLVVLALSPVLYRRNPRWDSVLLVSALMFLALADSAEVVIQISPVRLVTSAMDTAFLLFVVGMYIYVLVSPALGADPNNVPMSHKSTRGLAACSFLALVTVLLVTLTLAVDFNVETAIVLVASALVAVLGLGYLAHCVVWSVEAD